MCIRDRIGSVEPVRRQLAPVIVLAIYLSALKLYGRYICASPGSARRGSPEWLISYRVVRLAAPCLGIRCASERGLAKALRPLREPDHDPNPNSDESNHEEANINWRQEPDPLAVRYSARRKNRHQRTIGRHENVAQPAAVLVR